MLAPRKIKYRKPQKGKMRGMANSGDYVAFGTFGLKALECGWISSRQIEAARITISRRVRKVGRMWIRIFPHKAITKKPAETRMGKGKGAPEYWAATVSPGRILFEVDGIDLDLAKEALRLAAQKLPIKTKFVIRRDLQK